MDQESGMILFESGLAVFWFVWCASLFITGILTWDGVIFCFGIIFSSIGILLTYFGPYVMYEMRKRRTRMLNHKTLHRKISKHHSFCPYCGEELKKEKKE